jgi:hypothetical protein
MVYVESTYTLCRLYVDSFSSVYSRLDKGNRVCRVYVESISVYSRCYSGN